MSYGKARKVRERFSARRRFDKSLIDDYFDSGKVEPSPHRPVRIVFDAPRLSEVAYSGGHEPLFDEMLASADGRPEHRFTAADRAVATVKAVDDGMVATSTSTSTGSRTVSQVGSPSPRVPVQPEEPEINTPDPATPIAADALFTDKPILRMPLKIHRPSRTDQRPTQFNWLRFSMSIIAGATAAIFVLAARGESRRSMLNSLHHQSTLIGEVREDRHGDGAAETGASGDVLGSEQ